MKNRVVITLIGSAFAVALAVVIGLRLSTEAMAVIAGVVAGVAASIPASLIVIWLATRNAVAGPAREPQTNEPRIIYVNTTPPPSWPNAMSTPPHISALTTPHGAPWSPRHFTGLGGLEDAVAPVDAPTRAPVPGVSVIGGPE
ncbi:MAG: hypothetical protein HW418_1228 [Anaerolineales bacterium]|nr:hypothetical protein [Anaerolineales bacterium]